MFGEARKAVLLGNNLGPRIHLRIRFVRIRAIVELRHVLGGGDEGLNMLLGKLDLLHLLRSGHAEIRQSEIQKRREQYTQKPPTRGYRVSVSNERHGMALHLEYIACTPKLWRRHGANHREADVDPQCYRRLMRIIPRQLRSKVLGRGRRLRG